MASEDSLIGNDFVFQIGDDASPPNYADFCAVFDTGSIGEEKPQIDVTAICDLARKFRNGLAEGIEVPLQLNFLPDDVAAAGQSRALKEAYDNDEIMSFRLATKDVSPGLNIDFQATVRAWNVATPVGARAVLTFTLKISGVVTWDEQ